ncbi:transcriptional regulator, HxlR family [Mariprofundus ferrinatatus]|uniref:Transcriptional regulator, HxlR family n=1 Tax=Mariprofundus ferrinatatus TaxID=1921087 RepID=A0A2K8L7P4_9PROT|nr:helix-turn-helix domain-containing protein [Mariprofundus ferrinatatus]ATX80964.1 transcriptional regulator, HxlR family [Mariprofundus ferrinatatus]
MEAATPSPSSCPIGRLSDIIGDRWTILILRDLFNGVRRFDALQKSLGISKKILSQRLARLVESELLIRTPYQERPLRHEYRLTIKGRDLFPVLVSMQRWSNRWLFSEGETTTELVHLECGETLDARLTCGHCNGAVTPARVKAVRRPKREQ